MIDVFMAIGFFLLGLGHTIAFIVGFTCRQVYEKTGKVKFVRPDKVDEETTLRAIRPTKERFDRIDEKEKERGIEVPR